MKIDPYKLKLAETGILFAFLLYFLYKFDLGYAWNSLILILFFGIAYFFAMRDKRKHQNS